MVLLFPSLSQGGQRGPGTSRPCWCPILPGGKVAPVQYRIDGLHLSRLRCELSGRTVAALPDDGEAPEGELTAGQAAHLWPGLASAVRGMTWRARVPRTSAARRPARCGCPSGSAGLILCPPRHHPSPPRSIQKDSQSAIGSSDNGRASPPHSSPSGAGARHFPPTSGNQGKISGTSRRIRSGCMMVRLRGRELGCRRDGPGESRVNGAPLPDLLASWTSIGIISCIAPQDFPAAPAFSRNAVRSPLSGKQCQFGRLGKFQPAPGW